jgi:hypothetical protein
MAVVSQSPQPVVPGFRLLDGTQLNTLFGQIVLGSTDGITASTTQTRAGGKAITQAITRVATANSSDAVTLGGAGGVVAAGTVFIIANKSGQTIQVFPPGSGDAIDGGTAGASVNLANAKIGLYVVTANIGGVLTIASGGMAVSS